MQSYFNIRYEFDRDAINRAISERINKAGSDYICVADGVILTTATRDKEYLKVVNGGMFSICDSSYVPLYIKWIYGIRYHQYCGSQIFNDIIGSRKYRMIFIGASSEILKSLKENLMDMNPDVCGMQFIKLPYCNVDEFDYAGIADIIEKDRADIIWIALGAPKQEWFMHYLKPYLHRGVMIAVGAAFKFFSGVDANRAPKWMITNHLEFIHRIFSEPKKQLKRCGRILIALPTLLYSEWKRKRITERSKKHPRNRM